MKIKNNYASELPEIANSRENVVLGKRQIPLAQTFNRMLGSGVDPSDYANIVRGVSHGKDFVEVCEKLGDNSFEYAQQQFKLGHRDTSRIFFMKAAALFRVAPYEIIQFTEEKKRIYEKELLSYSKGIMLYENMRAEKIQIPYKNSAMAGWFYFPHKNVDSAPVIVMIGGLTGFKEESHTMAMKLVERGFTVLNIDYPGQGETFYYNQCFFEENNYAIGNSIVNYVINRHDVSNTIGLYGLCFGGFLVAQIAGYFPNQISACVCLGGSYDAKECLKFNQDFLVSLTMRFGKNQNEYEVVEELSNKFNLDDVIENIACPLLLIHNDPDPIISIENIKKLYNEAPSLKKELKVFSGPDHCAHNDKTEVSTYIVDWLDDNLLK